MAQSTELQVGLTIFLNAGIIIIIIIMCQLLLVFHYCSMWYLLSA